MFDVVSVRPEPTADDWLAAMRARSKFGIAIAAMIRMIATTISSSISEKPFCFRISFFPSLSGSFEFLVTNDSVVTIIALASPKAQVTFVPIAFRVTALFSAVGYASESFSIIPVQEVHTPKLAKPVAATDNSWQPPSRSPFATVPLVISLVISLVIGNVDNPIVVTPLGSAQGYEGEHSEVCHHRFEHAFEPFPCVVGESWH